MMSELNLVFKSTRRDYPMLLCSNLLRFLSVPDKTCEQFAF